MPAISTPLARFTPGGYDSSSARGAAPDSCRAPSKNYMVAGGAGYGWPGPLELADKIGGRLFFNTDASYGSLGTFDVAGYGNMFTVKQLLHAIGVGQVNFDGAPISGFIASSILSFIKKSAGVYAAGALTGPFQAGHAEPTAPTIYAKSNPSAEKDAMSGVVTVVAWRVSSITGGISNKSLPSNILTLNGQSCIVQFEEVDTNGQTHFGIGVVKVGFSDLGVHYQLPTSLGGEVAETTLAYTRTGGACSITSGSKTVTLGSADATGAEVGRRIAFDGFDSWITSINSAGSVEAFDTAGANYAGTGTITHAVDGYTRAVEISWSTGALFGQNVAPDKAFPPVAGQAAGMLNDTLFLEADNIIYVGEPGFTGSFPPSNAIFPNEPAVHYLRGSGDVYWRAGRHSIGAIAYIGGSPALEYQVVWENVGIEYPQNMAVGYGGRLMVFAGQPMILIPGQMPDSTFNWKVSEFTTASDQTEAAPWCLGFDPIGIYEIWAKEQKVYAQYVPTGDWCAPLDLTDLTIGNVVGIVTFNNKLYLSCTDGAQLKLYQYDAGTGSVMIVQTDDYRGTGKSDTITEVFVQGRVDNVANNVKVEIIVNGHDDSPIASSHNFDNIPTDENGDPIEPGSFDLFFTPNVVNAKRHAIRVTMESTNADAGLDCGVDLIETSGSSSGTLVA